MRAAYFENYLRPRRLARRDLGGHPAAKRSTRRRQQLPPLAELLQLPRERRTVTAKWEAA